MSSQYRLTSDQVQHFKEKGYVVVPELIEGETLDAWRSQFATSYGPYNQPETRRRMVAAHDERRHTTVPRDYRFQPESLQFHQQPGPKAVVDQLGGGQMEDHRDSNPHILWPAPEHDWSLPRPEEAHIDGYAGGHWYYFVLGSTTYLYDVKAQGGGTAFWPGSHCKTWEYFRRHPEEIATGIGNQDEYLDLVAGIEPVEITAGAGDVIFWHSFLYHSATTNGSDRPRYALFARYGHQREDEIKREVPDDLWTYWGI